MKMETSHWIIYHVLPCGTLTDMSHDYKMRIKMKSSNNLVYVNSTLMVCCHLRISKQIGFGAEISHPPVYFSLYFFIEEL